MSHTHEPRISISKSQTEAKTLFYEAI